MRSLIVALDAAASLRETCGGEEPRLSHLAVAAELGGADSIRVSVSESLQPVRENDLHDLRRLVRHLEMRLAPTPSLLKLALEVRPDRVLLAGESGVSDTPALSAGAVRDRAFTALRALTEAGIEGAVRIRPEIDAVKALHGAGARGVELCTADVVGRSGPERERAEDEFGDVVRLATKLRLPLGIGGRLGRRDLEPLLSGAPALGWVAAGRGLLAQAQLVGMERAVREFRDASR